MSIGIKNKFTAETGFSIIEILIVVGIIAILSAISLPYIVNYKRLYKSEDQALKVVDLMREASQLAVTRRRTFRLEIDLTENAVLIIDERNPDPATLVNETDVRIKKIPLEMVRDIRIDSIPTGVTKPNPPNYADAAFAADTI